MDMIPDSLAAGGQQPANPHPAIWFRQVEVATKHWWPADSTPFRDKPPVFHRAPERRRILSPPGAISIAGRSTLLL
jgi:hypothetical protein